MRWRRGEPDGRGPIADRVPLARHVAAMLLLTAAVGVAAGTGLWLALGRPSLTSVGSAAWTVQNTFDGIKIMLAVVAGIGGVVALTVAYRRQEQGEAAERRENTKLFTERFAAAATQLGADKAAVRLAGTYAMASLADHWAEGRQTCVDVLCAYLRMPGGTLADDERQVRDTILAVIGAHLRPVHSDQEGRARWPGLHFDLRGIHLYDADLHGIEVGAGTSLDLSGARFSGDHTSFGGLVISGGGVSFARTVFHGGTVSFTGAQVSDGRISFAGAEFSDGVTVSFAGAVVSGGGLSFSSAVFAGGDVSFEAAVFSGGTVSFRGSTFSAGQVTFRHACLVGGEVTFEGALFAGGVVDLSAPASLACPPNGLSATAPGVRLPTP